MQNFELLRDFIKFATLGVTTEVVFTAIVDNLNAYKAGEKVNKDLKGYSYIWMIPIYGSIAFFARLIFPLVQSYHFLLRALIYGIIILIVEYITGFIIRAITGKVPWHYDSKWSIHNLIRLDFLPLWMGFGIMVELYYRFF